MILCIQARRYIPEKCPSQVKIQPYEAICVSNDAHIVSHVIGMLFVNYLIQFIFICVYQCVLVVYYHRQCACAPGFIIKLSTSFKKIHSMIIISSHVYTLLGHVFVNSSIQGVMFFIVYTLCIHCVYIARPSP